MKMMDKVFDIRMDADGNEACLVEHQIEFYVICFFHHLSFCWCRYSIHISKLNLWTCQLNSNSFLLSSRKCKWIHCDCVSLSKFIECIVNFPTKNCQSNINCIAFFLVLYFLCNKCYANLRRPKGKWQTIRESQSKMTYTLFSISNWSEQKRNNFWKFDLLVMRKN